MSGRLSPRGTAAEQFLAARGQSFGSSVRSPAIPPQLEKAVARFELPQGILYRAWELARCAPEADEKDRGALIFLFAAVLVAQAQGSTRLPVGNGGRLDELLDWLEAEKKEREGIARILAGKAKGMEELVGKPGELKALIHDGGSLALHRMAALEHSLGSRLLARMKAKPDSTMIESALEDLLRRPPLAGGNAVHLSEEQRRALQVAARYPLAVISGGPGTGKTSIVVSLLRLLARAAIPPEQVAIAAPTGKAANRLTESIRAGLTAIGAPSSEDRQLLERPPPAQTLHRLLGYSPSRDDFRHHEGNPLSERVVVVDESSMIDLALMERLVRALPAQSRLVLLGDADQLPSVEAGSVFRDLIASAGSEASVRLTHSYRTRAAHDGGRQILEAAGLVNEGRADELLASLPVRSPEQLAEQGVSLVPCESAAELDRLLQAWFARHHAPDPKLEALAATTYHFGPEGLAPGQRPLLDELAARTSAARVLSVTRSAGRPTGAEAINARLAELWRQANRREGAGRHLTAGEPLMMLHNDYERGLFNGDQGVAVRANAGDASALHAAFATGGGWQAVRLGESSAALTRAFAMTVHKAQGSEVDHVLLVLPDEDLPLLTREILYTGLTRCRRSVTVAGAPELLRRAVQRRLVRHSGLGEAIAGA